MNPIVSDENLQQQSTAAEPVDSGVLVAQKPTHAIDTDLLAPEWKGQNALSHTLRELSEGASATAKAAYLVSSAGAQMQHEQVQFMRGELAELKEKLETATTALHDAQRTRDVLMDRQNAAPRKEVMLILGSSSAGAALAIYIAPSTAPVGIAHMLALFCMLLIGGAFLTQPPKVNPKP